MEWKLGIDALSDQCPPLFYAADLPSPCFDHKLPSQVWGWLWLQRSNDNGLVQGVPWDYLYSHQKKGRKDSLQLLSHKRLLQ